MSADPGEPPAPNLAISGWSASGWYVRSSARAVAFPSMEVRIGTTLDGQPAVLNTSSVRPQLLVGDVGRGKTTVARYLVRWWLADTTRHVHVFAACPGEWADLRCRRDALEDLEAPVGRDCRAGSCLVVVDDLHRAARPAVGFLPLGVAPVVLTSYGSAQGQLGQLAFLDGGYTSIGLVQRQPSTGGEAAVLEGQGRLDWPAGTVAVIPDQRGPLDFPCHRWNAATGAVAR